MDELSRDASELLRASHASASPSPATRRKLRIAIATGIGTGVVGHGHATVAPAATAGTAKLAAVAVIAGLIGFGGGAVVGHVLGSRSVETPRTAATQPAHVAAPIEQPQVEPTHDDEVAPAPVVAVPEPAVVARPRAMPPAPATSTLAAELALIRSADDARSGASAARALAVLDEHAARFPNGQLAQERDSLRVLALCDLQRVAEARAAAAAFFTRWPDSPHASRLRASCAAEAR